MFFIPYVAEDDPVGRDPEGAESRREDAPFFRDPDGLASLSQKRACQRGYKSSRGRGLLHRPGQEFMQLAGWETPVGKSIRQRPDGDIGCVAFRGLIAFDQEQLLPQPLNGIVGDSGQSSIL